MLTGHILGAGRAAGLFAAAGVGIGALVRSQLAGVIAVFAWCLVAESILGGTVNAVRPYLPYTAAATLVGAKLGAAAFGPGFRCPVSSRCPSWPPRPWSPAWDGAGPGGRPHHRPARHHLTRATGSR